MSAKSFILATLLAFAAAVPEPVAQAAAPATTTVAVYLPVDPQDLVAGVITANADFTSYTFTCAPGAQCDFAGHGGNLTVTGSSTYIMSVDGAAAGTPANNLHVACTSYNTNSVVCSETQNSVVAAGLSTTSVVFTQQDIKMIPLTVTSGAAALASAAAQATTAPTLTATGTATGTGSASAGASKTGGASLKEVSWVGAAGLAAAALVL